MTEMQAESAQRIRCSFILIGPQFDQISGAFYDRLFAARPDLRQMFAADMSAQRHHLGAALALIVRNLQLLDGLARPLADLGEIHARFGVRCEDYPVIRNAMIAAMAEALSSIHEWNGELERDWRTLIDRVAT